MPQKRPQNRRKQSNAPEATDKSVKGCTVLYDLVIGRQANCCRDLVGVEVVVVWAVVDVRAASNPLEWFVRTYDWLFRIGFALPHIHLLIKGHVVWISMVRYRGAAVFLEEFSNQCDNFPEATQFSSYQREGSMGAILTHGACG